MVVSIAELTNDEVKKKNVFDEANNSSKMLFDSMSELEALQIMD